MQSGIIRKHLDLLQTKLSALLLFIVIITVYALSSSVISVNIIKKKKEIKCYLTTKTHSTHAYADEHMPSSLYYNIVVAAVDVDAGAGADADANVAAVKTILTSRTA
uniref:Uncharacterized protein n=1 Tax=Glossina pallidipes TaxID=7398 RepID=A0A1B0A5S9_GLOPL